MDLPLPDTPVTQVKQPKGIFKSIFFKLFPVAPPISRNLPFFANFLPLGIGLNFLLDKYLPVILFSFDNISLYSPSAKTNPPLLPASGPRSII